MYHKITDTGQIIDYIRHVAVFSAVAKNGSFSEAARSLGIAPSRVSESVSKLEHYVGATLFNRTTRRISLTNEGRRLYAHTSDVLDVTERGLNELREPNAPPRGSLYISIPSFLSSSPLASTIGQFVASHKHVHITVNYTDDDVEPGKDGYDMCIRSGKFDSRNVRARRLGWIERAVFVGQGYLDGKGPPHYPKELLDWDWISYRHNKRKFEFKSKAGQSEKLAIQDQARLRVDNFDALISFVSMNLGVAVMPIDLAQRGAADNNLVRLFDDWHLPTVQYAAVWPDKSHRDSLISVFVDFLADQLKQHA